MKMTMTQKILPAHAGLDQVKPGDLIRGAKVGVAGLNKDGNVIGTGLDASKVIQNPTGGSNGDVLTKSNNGPVWANAAALATVDITDQFTVVNPSFTSVFKAYQTGKLIVIRFSLTNTGDTSISGPIIATSALTLPVTWYIPIIKSAGGVNSFAYIAFTQSGSVQLTAYNFDPGDTYFGTIIGIIA